MREKNHNDRKVLGLNKQLGGDAIRQDNNNKNNKTVIITINP